MNQPIEKNSFPYKYSWYNVSKAQLSSSVKIDKKMLTLLIVKKIEELNLMMRFLLSEIVIRKLEIT